MKSKSITYTKNHFSAVVREVEQGEIYQVCDYGRPVAEIRPVRASRPGATQGQLTLLEQRGLIRRARKPLPAGFLAARLPRPSDGASVVAALLEERGDSR